jgi:hypothetical protein
MRKVLLIICFFIKPLLGISQTISPGQLSGNFIANAAGYIRDDRIGANTTQYKKELSSAEGWLFLNYNNYGFNVMFRYDFFNNSPLLNPQEAYSNQGVGFWQISKDIEKLNITVGSFYDQFGSGAVFRSFEDRALGIDYAIEGARLKYNFTENFRLKAFTGKEKFRFGRRDPIIKGINLENSFQLSSKAKLAAGASLVNRTIDEESMRTIADNIRAYDVADRFVPKFNVFLYNAYATLRFKKIAWTVEYNRKTREAIQDRSGKLVNRDGQVYFTSLSYSKKGLGINFQFKRIDSFPFRTSPLENLLNGQLNYLPSVTRQNVYRLLARFNAVVQDLGENAIQGDILWSPNKKMTINLNVSYVNRLDAFTINKSGISYKLDTKNLYFNEYYLDVNYKFSKKFKAMLGVQLINYNKEINEGKPQAHFVHAFTPFGEATYKISPTKSFRLEVQHLGSKQDFGSFFNALLEYNIAPRWSFSAGDMFNYKPGVDNPTNEVIHYYTFFTAFTQKTSRFTLAYVKQVAGVNCTGGVCRIEPAFNGVKFTLSTNF